MSPLVASLPIYNLPEIADANTAFWSAILEELEKEGITDIPRRLQFESPPVPDRIHPGAIFTQMCGYPLQTIYSGQYQLLGVPTYDVPGCGNASHRAFVLVRADSAAQRIEDLKGGTFALNSWHSNSGMNLPRMLFARVAKGQPFFGRVVETGSHPASMQLVTSGGADAASIDCVTYAFLCDHRPHAVAGLRRLADTPESPAIPFITAADTPPRIVHALRRALFRIADDRRRQPILQQLHLRQIEPADPAAYGRLLNYEREAAALGYGKIT